MVNLRLTRAAASVAIVSVVALTAGFAACGSGSGDKPQAGTPSISAIYEQLFKNFQKAVANAKNEGYTPYWLGRRFDAGGVTFSGPSTDGSYQGREGGGVRFSYTGTSTVPPHDVTILDFDEYSAQAWGADESYYRNKGGADIVVAGHGAKVVQQKNDSARTIALLLIVSIGETTIVARAPSVIDVASSPGAGSEGNPLMDQATFLAVMQNLRPYPQ
jgi:hypothetical protein